MVDLSNLDLTGADAEKLLEGVNITLNKNAIPFDKKSPSLASGIRIGGAAITSRGLNESDSLNVAKFIVRALKTRSDIELKQIKKEVVRFIRDFDMP